MDAAYGDGVLPSAPDGVGITAHSRCVIIQMADMTVPHELFAAIPQRIRQSGTRSGVKRDRIHGDQTVKQHDR